MSGSEPTEASTTDVGAAQERDAEPKGAEAGSRIDRVARALFAYACLPGQPGRWYSGVRKIYEASAKAAIAADDAALSEAGLVIVPAAQAISWQPIETLPDTGEPLVLAKTADGRRMIWRSSILRAAMKEGTPAHLGFPAIAWMPVPE